MGAPRPLPRSCPASLLPCVTAPCSLPARAPSAPPTEAQAAKQAGDFLLVGVHGDEDVTERRGPHLPIMGLHERALSVLSCRYVDEVVIGAWRAGGEGRHEAERARQPLASPPPSAGAVLASARPLRAAPPLRLQARPWSLQRTC